LDWYHLRENIYQTLKRTLPDDDERIRAIRNQITQHFWEGCKDEAFALLEALKADLIEEELQAVVFQPEGLQVLIEYVHNNWNGIVAYDKMHQDGYLVASSLVEKAADIVVAKRQKKRQGMHWSHEGADSVCALRTLWLNEEWDTYWQNKRAA
jgi:hypothetical protein